QAPVRDGDRVEQPGQVDTSDKGWGLPAPTAQKTRAVDGGSRPPGFTRAVREFHRAIMIVRPEELSGADRAALRALFRDLVLLARASTTPMPRVFPPLPGART